MSLVAAKFNPGVFIAFGTVTGTYATIATVPGGCVSLNITHSFNQPVVLSLDGGVTDHIFLLPNITATYQPVEFGANGVMWSGSLAIKHAGAAPTGGAVAILPVRRS